MVRRILDKIFPPKEKAFFDYFVDGARICRVAAGILFDIMHEGLTEERVESARNLKHKGVDLTKRVLIHLNATFITPIDREEIREVSILLNEITKRIVKVCFMIKTYRLTECSNELKEQSETLIKAMDELNIMMSNFKDFKQTKKRITEISYHIKEIEGQGDDILYRAMFELFSGRYEVLTVIKLKDIHHHIERSFDLCLQLSNLIVNIVLKHT